MFNEEHVIIRKGGYVNTYTSKSPTTTATMTKHAKNFVFDLDETIGAFSDLHILWQGLAEMNKLYSKTKLFCDNQDTFNLVLALYPEFLRYGIITILEFLYYKKRRGDCEYMCIYTNNQCPGSWALYIITYLEIVGKMPGLFDQIINAFKIDGHIIEENRTANTKSFSDLIRCTLLPKNAEICFIDNTYFPKMKHNRVFYIQPKPYHHALSLDEMVSRIVMSNLGQKMIKASHLSPDQWELHLWDWCIGQGCIPDPIMKSVAEREEDIHVSQKLMYHIKEFFYLSMRKPKTRKIMGRFWHNVSKKCR